MPANTANWVVPDSGLIQLVADRYGMSAVVNEFRTPVITEFRKPVMTMVEVSWQDTGGSLQTVPARMEDKSASGACIRLQVPIVVGSILRIRSRLEHFSGTARYCRSDGREYLVGIHRDATMSPLPNRPDKANVLPQENAKSSDALVSPAKIQSPPKRLESEPNKVPPVEQRFEQRLKSAPIVRIARSAATPAPGVGGEVDNRDSPRSRPRDFNALGRTELQSKRIPKQAVKERKHMQLDWLELPWRKKQKERGVTGPGNDEGRSKGNSKSEKENFMSHLTESTLKAPVHSAREVPTFQVELSSVEDIYRAAGIMNPRSGYSISKVVEMLNSEHIRDLSKEMKRAAVLMALDTAGTPIDQVQKDAKARQDALDSHEAQQRKQLEAEWARKSEEIIQIQADLESIRAHYTARIGRNMEGVAREQATFASWLALKQQECQSIADAVELCLKPPVSEPVTASAAPISVGKVSAKTV